MSDEGIVKYITIKEASKLLGVSPLTLRNWDKKKKLVAYRHPINNYRVYKLEELKSFMGKIQTRNLPKKINIEVLEDKNEPDPRSPINEEDILEI